jgi:signal transduction histidine kinase
MSAHAAIAPAAEFRARRASPVRMAVIAGVYLAIVVPAVVYPLVSPLRTAAELLPRLLWLAVMLGSFARQPDGRIWKLIFLMAVAERVVALEYVPNSIVANLARVTWVLGVGVSAQFLLTFPTGYIRDRFDSFVVGLTYGVAVAFELNELLFAGDWVALGCNPDCLGNAFIIWPNAELHDWLENLIVSGYCLVVIPLIIVALWRHWRVAAGVARRTLLPIVVGGPLLLLVTMVEILSRELDFAPGIAFFESPSGVAIHVIAPVVLPAGLLIGMVRARWSRGRVANLVVELGRGVPVGGLRDVLARALGDPSLQLAFAAPTGSGYVDASGQAVELPVGDPARTVTRLEREDELLGVLVHDPAIEAEDPGLVEAVGNAARLALENERLAAEVRAQLEEVRASRARIVEAADAERRRVERDLHDGAQQRLVALALRLEVARKTTPGSAAVLDEATGELQTAIGEVRGLARGIHPTILTEAGLRAAVDALAERTPLPVAVDIPERRFDPQLEATAYFVVAEALTNVARYAEASEARVAAAEDDGRLVVTVADDGRGGADPAAGSGLRGLSDRLAAIDGRLTVASPPGGGTTVRAELPLEGPSAPAATPAPAAASALARVRAVPEPRALPRPAGRVRLSSPAVLIAVIAVAIAAAAMVAAIPGMQPSGPESGRAETFIRPFDYQVPAGSRIGLYAKSVHLHVLSAPPGNVWGVSIWGVEDVLKDPCSWGPEAPVVSREPGVEGLLAYVRSIHAVRVEDRGPAIIDGRPASRVDLTNSGSLFCRDSRTGAYQRSNAYLWRDEQGIVIQVPLDGHVPVTVLDVDGETIAIEIWAGGQMEDWLPTAEEIVGSIRFLHRPAASPTTSTSSP